MKTHMSMNNIPLPDPMPEMKATVESVLAETGYSEKRAAKMDINDFMAVLAAFNARGIHFS